MPTTAKLDRAMLRGVRCEGTARETGAAHVQERHPVFRGGTRIPKGLHSGVAATSAASTTNIEGGL